MAKKKEVVTKELPKTFKPMPEAEPEAQDIRRDGPALIETLTGLKGMNRELAERIASEWRELRPEPVEGGGNDVEVAARFGLDVMTAAEVIKVMEVSK